LKAPWLVPMAQSERVTASGFDEALRFGGIGQQALPSSTLMSSSTPPNMPRFGFNADPLGVGTVHDALVIRDVLVERFHERRPSSPN